MDEPEPESLSGLVVAALDALRENRTTAEPMHRMCQACVSLLPVDGTSLSVIPSPGRRETFCATDKVIAHADDVQFSLGEGPCYEAFDTGRPVLVPDLAQDASPAWPVFAAEIHTEPIGALFAFPLRRGAARLGGLDMYRRRPGWLSTRDIATAVRIADIATAVLLSTASGHGDPPSLDGLIHNHAVVHQATGMVIAEFRIPVDQALARLRGYAFSSGRRLDDIATDMVGGRLHPNVLSW
ncbi:GAF and ANTAR domain-containing protein [Saccharomonospora sp. NPDC046836]|uniref:GAF and ANTAR domain-containing protein n=1 Tax=Saccharomonospora sp. NPDC046836 TaxID=3156921 RepID=UPI00340D4789